MALDKIKTIIAEHFNINEADITAETTMEELGADSLDIVELIMGLEDEFGITFPDSEASNIKTVADISKYVEESK